MGSFAAGRYAEGILLTGVNLSRPAPHSRSRPAAGFSWFYVGLFAAGLLVLIGIATFDKWSLAQRPVASNLKLADIPIDGERAYGYLREICAIGPRVSGTDGMRRQQEYLQAHFEKLGGRVSLQQFPARHPLTGARVGMANMIVEWHAERKDRILLCAHYDTRPFPDQDTVDPKGLFVGANDGASGAALFCELAHHMPELKSKYGVDFVLFDGEELVYDGQRDPYFLGSEHFAREYLSIPPPHRYKYGVLLDMIGDANLQIYREVNSMRTPQTRQLNSDIFGVARSLGVKEFIASTRHEVRDDHLALNQIAKIPTIDLIDFDYPTSRGRNYWHTTQDTPDKCSALSLAKVGWVLLEWAKRAK
jgi:glutaminyl-peptide cyclotransferase